MLLAGTVFFSSCRQKKTAGDGTFRLLTQEQSNIDFANTNTANSKVNILDYLYFYNGAGVASADFNNDGLQDLYFISNQGPNKLYLNKGGLKFEDITKKRVSPVPGTGNRCYHCRY